MRRLRRLVQKRSLRWSEGVCVLEGPDLVESALDAGAEFEAIYVNVTSVTTASLEGLLHKAERAGVRIFGLAPEVLAQVTDAKTPQPVTAVVRLPLSELVNVSAASLVLVLHELRDPGNVGTIIRTADAAGVDAVVLTGQSVDPFNPKTLRATAGSVFHVPIVVCTLDEAIVHFVRLGASILASVVHGGATLRDVDFSRPTVVIIGNEAEGLTNEVIDRSDATLSIPMVGRSESLNAGVAASLIAFEALRQHQDADEGGTRPSLEGS